MGKYIYSITHTLKAISKYSLTEAHRSSTFLDVPFLTPFSVKDAFLIDIAINKTKQTLFAFDDLPKRHAGEPITNASHSAKRGQTSSDAGGGWAEIRKTQTMHLSEKRPQDIGEFSKTHTHTHEQQAPMGHTHTFAGARSHWLRGGDIEMTPDGRRDRSRRAHYNNNHHHNNDTRIVGAARARSRIHSL